MQATLHATHLLKLLDKTYKYELDPTRTVGATERAPGAGRTDGQTDGRIDGVNRVNQYNPPPHPTPTPTIPPPPPTPPPPPHPPNSHPNPPNPTTPLRASYEVSTVRNWTKINRVTMAMHCMKNFIMDHLQSYSWFIEERKCTLYTSKKICARFALCCVLLRFCCGFGRFCSYQFRINEWFIVQIYLVLLGKVFCIKCHQ